MTTTSTFSGVDDNAKPTSRVLRPPGGGSSNIFGDPEPARATAKSTGASNKPADSGIFNASGNDSKSGAQRSARDGDDSFGRLFGDTGSPAPSQKGTSASQRVDTHANLFGDSPNKAQAPTEPKSTHQNLFGGGSTNGQGEGSISKGSYNPITGSDYKDLAPNHHALNVKETPKPQKEQPPLACSDGEFQAREGKMQNVQTSTRVTNPPGGKTHKLW